jgi:hypothetical protein
MLWLRLLNRRGRSFSGRCSNCGRKELGRLAARTEFGNTVFKPAQPLAGAQGHNQGDNRNPADNQLHRTSPRLDL